MGLNDFALNLVYAHLFPHFYLPPHGSRPLWDGGDGKVVERALQRVEDTIRNNLLWWFHGPSHPKTRQSVAGVNKLHAYHARRHPGSRTRFYMRYLGASRRVCRAPLP